MHLGFVGKKRENKMVNFGFFITAILVFVLERSFGFQKVGKTGVGKSSRVVGLIIAHSDIGVFNKIIDSWFV
jgi:hypothetical protein